MVAVDPVLGEVIPAPALVLGTATRAVATGDRRAVIGIHRVATGDRRAVIRVAALIMIGKK